MTLVNNSLRKRVLLISQAKKYDCYDNLLKMFPFIITDKSLIINDLLKISIKIFLIDIITNL
jgi:hypothetical protein